MDLRDEARAYGGRDEYLNPVMSRNVPELIGMGESGLALEKSHERAEITREVHCLLLVLRQG